MMIGIETAASRNFSGVLTTGPGLATTLALAGDEVCKHYHRPADMLLSAMRERHLDPLVATDIQMFLAEHMAAGLVASFGTVP